MCRIGSHSRRIDRRAAIALMFFAAVCVYAPSGGLAQESAGEEPKYGPRELEKEIYQVSNIEAKRCLEILGSLGYTVGPPTGPLSLVELPCVFGLSDTEQDSVVGAADKLNPSTDSSPQQRLMILYHSSQLSEVAELRRLLTETVDVPCRQVLIEALVIELSEKAARELGFNYEFSCPHMSITFKPDESSDVPYLQVEAKKLYEGVEPNARRLQATIKSIIDERQAEVLSSPSVLTLDNRQARITITEEVPIIQSTAVTGGTVTVNVSFKKVGITLNIKPRVSEDGSWVTLQVQTEVSEAPLEDYLVVGGEPVAPLVNSRKVETIAQIKNNTPFIIGGLIRDERAQVVARVPVISGIPILGNLFKVRSDRNEKREVIIVLTPRVIEAARASRPILPKDTTRFDFLDNRLFRNSYRLKAEDVFDLGFITENREIQSTFGQAHAFLETHPEYRDKPPFDLVQAGAIPGEEAIVIRMLYEITKKLGLHDRVDMDRLIYFAPAPLKPAGFEVTFLSRTLDKLAAPRDVLRHLDRRYPKDVLLLKYELHREEAAAMGKALPPVASVEVRRVESRKQAEQLLYDYSRTDGYKRTHSAILIADPDDLERLRAAVALREVLLVNNVQAILHLANFQVGRRIVVPELDPSGERIFLIDDTVADLYFQSDFYYEAFQEKFRAYYQGIHDILGGHEP